MNHHHISSLSHMKIFGLASTAMLGMLSSAAHAQTTAKDLVGVWQIASNVTTLPDSRTIQSFGPHGIGNQIFLSNGRFTAVQVNPDMPKFKSNNRAQGTADENKAAVIGGLAEFGTYSVADNVITLHIEGCTYPNWIGTDQKRNITSFTGDEMNLAFGGSFGGQSKLTWKRIK
jgi:hypothetical protein